MDLHLVSDRIRTFRDTAAPLEIIHVVYDEISSCSWQKGRDLLSNLTGRSALIPHSNSGMDQKSLSHSTVFTVDQMQGRRFDVVSGNLGRLESSTHVFGKNNGYDLVSGIQVFLESLLKFVRIYSGGGRSIFAVFQQIIKCLVGQIHTTFVICLTETNGKGHNIKVVFFCVVHGKIAQTVSNNSYHNQPPYVWFNSFIHVPL